jgi:hypothetical protein
MWLELAVFALVVAVAIVVSLRLGIILGRRVDARLTSDEEVEQGDERS